MVRPPTTSRSRAPSPSRRWISSAPTARPSPAPTRRSSSPSRTVAIDDPGPRARIEAALAKVQKLEGVAPNGVGNPFAEGGTISPDGKLASVDVRYITDPNDIDKADGEALLEAGESARGDGVDVAARGILIDLASEQEAPVGELVGIGIAIILLWLLFHSAAAMGATLIGALIGVIVGQLLLAVLAKPLGLPAFASVIAVMLGLGAGIDYALLIIGRYREQVAAGDSRRDASAKSAATSGASVVAAGLVVMLAIAGLLVIGIPFIGKLGLAAAIAVGAVVVSALTILPVMIGLFGRKLEPKKPEHVRPSESFGRWGEIVTAKPWLSIAAGVIVLLLFAAPVTQLRLGQPDDGNQPESKTQRVAYDRLSEAFGAGSNGPFLLAVDIPKGDAANEANLQKLQDAVAATPGMQSVAPATTERGRRDGDDLRHPEDRPAGRRDQRPARAPAHRRHPGRGRRHAAAGLRRRQHRGLRGLLGQGRRPPAAVHRRRHRPLRAAADHGLPLALDPARVGRCSTCSASARPTAS